MSVKQWKQVITISVILIIVLLLILTIFFALRVHNYQKDVESGKLVNLAQFGELDAKELSGLFKYLGSVEADSNLEYQTLFPDLYIDNDFNFIPTDEKIAYLTFDDGPNADNTPVVLDTLKKYNVKATFFVVYQDTPTANALYKRIVDEGHTIAVHTASHEYTKIYESVESYLTDFEKMASHIEAVTGTKPEIFRFPGGSINSYNAGIYREIIAEMTRRGYVYYDWNVSSGDAASGYISRTRIANNVLNGSASQDDAIVLMHDGPGHGETAAALPQIIEGLKKQGYIFQGLDNTVTPWCFGY